MTVSFNTVTITDTGKRRTNSAVAEETDKANNGTAISLHGVDSSYSIKALLNTASSIGKLSGGETTQYTNGEVDHVGVTQPRLSIRGVLNIKSNADMLVLKEVVRLAKTKGYKTVVGDLHYAVTGWGGSTPINVRVESVDVTQRSNSNIIDYNINCYETS
jgi:hypothetical protein